MKRIIAICTVVLALAGCAGTPAQAAAVNQAVALSCLSRTSTVSSPGSWHYVMTEGWWQIGPLHASSACGGYVMYRSDGWRFSSTQCGQIWGRRPSEEGGTYIVPGSVRHVCGGDAIVVLSRCRCQTFWLEAWPYASADRNSYTWPLGVVLF